MTEIPECGLNAGRVHDDNRPPAVVVARLDWEARDGAFMRRVRPLCLACYTDKAEKTREHAGQGERSMITITVRYPGGETLPERVGRAHYLEDPYVRTGDGS